MIINLLVVFIISGLWHGANWTFIIWGTLHGLFLIGGNSLKRIHFFQTLRQTAFGNGIGMLTTFLFVCFAWIFFRANSLSDALYISSAIAKIDFGIVKDLLYIPKSIILNPHQFFDRLNFDFGRMLFQMSKGDFLLCFAMIPGLVSLEWLHINDKLNALKEYRFGIYYLLVMAIFLFGIFSKKQFIYFQF